MCNKQKAYKKTRCARNSQHTRNTQCVEYTMLGAFNSSVHYSYVCRFAKIAKNGAERNGVEALGFAADRNVSALEPTVEHEQQGQQRKHAW